jgi:CRP-like cAMP-binding protein
VATTQVVRSERFPDLADEVLFPRLSDGKLAWLAKRGTRRRFEPGEVLYEHAERDAPFYVIERGRVEFIDRKPGKDVYVAQADGRTYIGDIAAFTGEPTISACVAVEPTDVIVFDRAGLRAMVARWPEFGEQVFATLLARRAWHEAEGHGLMRLISAGVRGSRAPRAQSAAGALVRRGHRYRERPDARVARYPALRDAGADLRDRGDAQSLGSPGCSLASPARGR